MRTGSVEQDALAAEPFDLGTFDCMKTVLQMPDGNEHILLRRHGMSVQLASRGTSVLHVSVSASFEIEGLSRAQFVCTAFAKLRRMKQPERAVEGIGWPNSGLHLRDYLIAFDGTLNDATYRQIAQAICGPERVKDVWTGESRFLKEKIRRAAACGLELMNSGYRDRLRKP